MYDLILKNVARHITLKEAEEKYFLSVLRPRTVRKRQYLLQAGDICRHEIFVNKGLLRAYTSDNKGQEHIVMFASEGWWTSDFYSRLTNTPATLNIDALEDSEVFLIEKDDLDKLYEEVEKFNKLFRILLQNSVISQQQRILGAMSQTAEERYQAFLKRYPNLEQRVTQQHIASFLGVTPETLSRIRKQWTK